MTDFYLSRAELGHLLKRLQRVDRLLFPGELAVDVGEVHDEPLALAPVQPAVKRDRAGRLQRRHPLLPAHTRLRVEILEVGLQLAHRMHTGDWPVPRHDHLDVEREDPIAGGDPVRDRPGPCDRMAAVEEDVAGEEHAGGGHQRKRVPARVGGADLDQLHLARADLQGELAAEGLIG